MRTSCGKTAKSSEIGHNKVVCNNKVCINNENNNIKTHSLIKAKEFAKTFQNVKKITIFREAIFLISKTKLAFS